MFLYGTSVLPSGQPLTGFDPTATQETTSSDMDDVLTLADTYPKIDLSVLRKDRFATTLSHENQEIFESVMNKLKDAIGTLCKKFERENSNYSEKAKNGSHLKEKIKKQIQDERARDEEQFRTLTGQVRDIRELFQTRTRSLDHDMDYIQFENTLLTQTLRGNTQMVQASLTNPLPERWGIAYRNAELAKQLVNCGITNREKLSEAENMRYEDDLNNARKLLRQESLNTILELSINMSNIHKLQEQTTIFFETLNSIYTKTIDKTIFNKYFLNFEQTYSTYKTKAEELKTKLPNIIIEVKKRISEESSLPDGFQSKYYKQLLLEINARLSSSDFRLDRIQKTLGYCKKLLKIDPKETTHAESLESISKRVNSTITLLTNIVSSKGDIELANWTEMPLESARASYQVYNNLKDGYTIAQERCDVVVPAYQTKLDLSAQSYSVYKANLLKTMNEIDKSVSALGILNAARINWYPTHQPVRSWNPLTYFSGPKVEAPKAQDSSSSSSSSTTSTVVSEPPAAQPSVSSAVQQSVQQQTDLQPTVITIPPETPVAQTQINVVQPEAVTLNPSSGSSSSSTPSTSSTSSSNSSSSSSPSSSSSSTSSSPSSSSLSSGSSSSTVSMSSHVSSSTQKKKEVTFAENSSSSILASSSGSTSSTSLSTQSPSAPMRLSVKPGTPTIKPSTPTKTTPTLATTNSSLTSSSTASTTSTSGSSKKKIESPTTTNGGNPSSLNTTNPTNPTNQKMVDGETNNDEDISSAKKHYKVTK